MKKRIDYSLNDTEKLWDAVKKTTTHVKDYSMKHIIQIIWEPSGKSRRTRLVEIRIGNKSWAGKGGDLTQAVDRLISDKYELDHLWATKHWIKDAFGRKDLILTTDSMNSEALRDHIAEVAIGENKALVDLEELLKATRYA